MDRRNFLKGVLTTAAIAAIPVPILNSFISGATDTINIDDSFIVDYTTRTIKYVGTQDAKGINMKEFYNWLKDQEVI